MNKLFCTIGFGVLSLVPGWAGYLSLTNITPGTAATFTGTLDGVTVNGSITTSTPHFQLNGPGSQTSWEASTIDKTSPQFIS